MIDLAALAADPARAAEVPVAEVPALLALIAAEQARLAALQGALAARLVTAGNGHVGNGDPDRWLTAEEVAQRTEFSVDYVYRHADKFPFTRRQGRTLRFSEAGLVRWMAQRR